MTLINEYIPLDTAFVSSELALTLRTSLLFFNLNCIILLVYSISKELCKFYPLTGTIIIKMFIFINYLKYETTRVKRRFLRKKKELVHYKTTGL